MEREYNTPSNMTLEEEHSEKFSELENFFDAEIMRMVVLNQKKQNYVLKKLALIQKQYINSKKDRFFSDSMYSKIKLLSDLASFVTVEDIKDLPQMILQKKEFRPYTISQVIIHERGKMEVVSYYSMAEEKTKKIIFDVSTFNNVFNIIKKSKNKLFNQSQVFQENPATIGSFLAKELELKNHRIIFIISRNDFIPTGQEEQSYFTNFVNGLKNFMNILLLQEQRSTRTLLIQKTCTTVASDIEQFKQKSLTPDILHFQRIALLGELLNTLKHELSNPLFGLTLMADVMCEEITHQEANQFMRDISAGCARCHDIIKGFSLLYRDSNDSDEIDLEKLISEVLTLTKSETRGIIKNFIMQDNLKISLVKTNLTWITQILFNIVLNSAQAMKIKDSLIKTENTISITASISTKSNYLKISISDSGPGIDKTIIGKVFDPFFTTKQNGSGLGLTICKNLATKLESKITCKNNYPMPGTTFSLKLGPGRYRIEKNVAQE